MPGAEPVDQEHDVRRSFRQHQPAGCGEYVGAERVRDRGHDVAQRAAPVRRFDERARLVVAQLAWVRAESCSANDSNRATESWPSAAAETRSEKSSEARTPV